MSVWVNNCSEDSVETTQLAHGFSTSVKIQRMLEVKCIFRHLFVLQFRATLLNTPK